MHGAGNDFIVLNGIDQDLSNITREEWQKLAHRQFGIGADQILLVEKATRLMPIFVIAFLMLMVVRWSNAAMVHAASFALCSTKAFPRKILCA